MGNYVPAEGPADARLVVVGEAPGEQEDTHKRPFYPFAPSGKVLTGALGGDAGRARVRLTNVRKMLPPKKQAPAARLADLKRWHEEFEAEIGAATEARTLLLIGEDAFKAVCGSRTHIRANGRREDERAISLWHGSVLTRGEVEALRATHEGERPLVGTLPPRLHSVVVTLHPAFAFRGRMPFMAGIRTNIRRAVRWAWLEAGPERPPFPELTPAPDRVDLLLRWAEEVGQPVAIDVETPEDAHKRIVVCGVAAGRKAMAFPWEGEYVEVVKRAWERCGVFVGHNIIFDLNAFAAYGIQPSQARKVVDTIIAAARITPPFEGSDEARWFSLAACVLRWCDGEAFWKKPDWETTKAVYAATWPGLEGWEMQRAYCAADCTKTLRLWWAERALLEKEGML